MRTNTRKGIASKKEIYRKEEDNVDFVTGVSLANE